MEMLDFMDRPLFYSYSLSARFGDCEPNLLSFNYITPMAVCVEAMVKSAWLEYDKRISEDYAETVSLFDLLFNKEDDKARQYTPFRKWFREQYDLDKDLLDDIDKLIRKEANKYKHSLLPLSKRNKAQKRNSFNCFYRFSAKYYKKITGEDAPSWDENKFDELMQTDDERSIRCAGRLMP